jgi:hypothetical protein
MTLSNQNNGVEGGIQTTLPVEMILSAFAGITWYLCIELNVRIFRVFRRYRGLYFWSIFLSSWGTFFEAIFALIKFFQVVQNNFITGAFILIFWCLMVSGQSLVLYSRLHLVVQDGRKIKWVLYMIIFDAIVLHIPIIVLAFLSNSSMSAEFSSAYSIYDRVEMTVFSAQEFIISSLYVFETYKLLKSNIVFRKKRTRQVMRDLIYINILIVILDLTLLALEYANLFMIQGICKTTVYAIKLRMEFPILNQLKKIADSNQATGSFGTDLMSLYETRPPGADDGTVEANLNEDKGSQLNVYTSNTHPQS